MWMMWPSEWRRMLPLCLLRVFKNMFNTTICTKIYILILIFKKIQVIYFAHSPIFHLQQIRYQTVRRTALHEIPLGGLEVVRFRRSVFVHKVIGKAFVRVLFDLMQWHGVENGLDKAAVVREADNLVRTHPNGDVFLLPNKLESLRTVHIIDFIDINIELYQRTSSNWVAISSWRRSSPHLTMADNRRQLAKWPYGEDSRIWRTLSCHGSW